MKALIYLRVSTLKQATKGHSLATQEENCRAWVAGEGGELVAVLVDKHSGRDIDRPDYRKALDFARNGQIDTVVVAFEDRSGRDLREYFNMIGRFTALGCEWIDITDPYASELTRNIRAVVAAEESVKIAARVGPAIRYLLNSGRWVGAAPRGYRIVEHSGGGKTLEPNDDAPFVARLFEMYATGDYSLQMLRQETRVWGWSTYPGGIGRSTLVSLLRNPAYTGKVVWSRQRMVKDEEGHKHRQKQDRENWTVKPGDHKAIVDQDTFDQVQRVLDTNRLRKTPAPAERQLLIGFIYCACGSRMQSRTTVSKYRGKTTVYHSYYCVRHAEEPESCNQQSVVSVRKIDPQVRQAIARAFRSLSRAERREAEALIESEAHNFYDRDAQRKVQLATAQQKTKNRMVALTTQKLDGEIPNDVYQDTLTMLRTQLASIEAEQRDVADAQMPDLRQEIALLATRNWDGLDTTEWRMILPQAVSRVVITGTKATIDWSPMAERVDRIMESARRAAGEKALARV